MLFGSNSAETPQDAQTLFVPRISVVSIYGPVRRCFSIFMSASTQLDIALGKRDTCALISGSLKKARAAESIEHLRSALFVWNALPRSRGIRRLTAPPRLEALPSIPLELASSYQTCSSTLTCPSAGHCNSLCSRMGTQVVPITSHGSRMQGIPEGIE